MREEVIVSLRPDLYAYDLVWRGEVQKTIKVIDLVEKGALKRAINEAIIDIREYAKQERVRRFSKALAKEEGGE